MSSDCSSPLSQHSRHSSTSPFSPQTAVTTPRSFNGDSSPKLDSLSFSVTPPSPGAERSHFKSPSPCHSLPTFPVTQAPFSPKPWEEQTNYQRTPTSPYPEEPSAYDQVFNAYHQQLPQPCTNFLDTSVQSPTGGYFGFQDEYSPWTGYSGYPPASAFYGPLPTEISSAGSSPSTLAASPVGDLAYTPIDPLQYKFEHWETADGRKVEYSAMHLHCATM